MGVAAASFSTGSANAVVIEYTFNATYTDGNVANGTFLFDSVTPIASNILINTSGGTTYPARSFSQTQFLSDQGIKYAFAMLDPTDGPDFTGDPTFTLRFFTNGAESVPAKTSKPPGSSVTLSP